MSLKPPEWTSLPVVPTEVYVTTLVDAWATFFKYSPTVMNCAATSVVMYPRHIIMINAKGTNIWVIISSIRLLSTILIAGTCKCDYIRRIKPSSPSCILCSLYYSCWQLWSDHQVRVGIKNSFNFYIDVWIVLCRTTHWKCETAERYGFNEFRKWASIKGCIACSRTIP